MTPTTPMTLQEDVFLHEDVFLPASGHRGVEQMTPMALHEDVFALDPGNFNSAFCVLHGDGQIRDFAKLPNHEILERLQLLAHCPQPVRVVCEMVASYGMAVGASVFETCVFIGQCKQLVRSLSLPWEQVVRLEVKLAICHSPRANDSAIRTALIDLFGAPGTRKSPGPTYGITKDIWAALALAQTVRTGQYRPYVNVNERPPAAANP